jgi:hypothetical protein
MFGRTLARCTAPLALSALIVGGLTVVDAATAIAAGSTPTFVRQGSVVVAGKTSAALTLSAATPAGDRLIVEVATWNSTGATTSAVTDSAADAYTELTHFTAVDGTELSVWSAPVATSATPTITAKATGTADIGVLALDYNGLSTVTGATAVDQLAHASGTTVAAATVSSGTTSAATSANELAIGFYADSGFSDHLTSGSGYTQRANVSPNSNLELLAEDQPVVAGATPGATVGTGANTIWLAATLVFKSAVAAPPTAPWAPSGVTAAPGNTTASVIWSAPPNGGSPITSYTVTPFVNATAQAPIVVSGNPPVTAATITGLTNGTTYTFTVTATNAIGTSPPSAVSNSVTPAAAAPIAFVQSASAHQSTGATISVTPTSPITTGNRLVVEAATWSSGGATVSKVSDAEGDPFVEVTQFTASDGTEMTVWTAPITGVGGKPAITATATSSASVGISVSEYANLSAVASSAVVDRSMQATGTTGGAVAVGSGSTMATTADNELAIGFYADSGFGVHLVGAPGYAVRSNVSPTDDIQLLTEDVPVSLGALPAASVTTGANTIWLMATIVFKHA